jgi:hypothetical protein
MGAFRCGGCEGDDDAMVYNPIDNTAPQRAPTPQVFSERVLWMTARRKK